MKPRIITTGDLLNEKAPEEKHECTGHGSGNCYKNQGDDSRYKPGCKCREKYEK